MFTEVSSERMRQVAGELNKKALEMEDSLNKIKTLMEKIGGNDIWSGSSATAVREEFDKLSSHFPSFREAVSNCSQGLTSFASNYDSAEASISAAAQG